jgi:hypothetical protein
MTWNKYTGVEIVYLAFSGFYYLANAILFNEITIRKFYAVIMSIQRLTPSRSRKRA